MDNNGYMKTYETKVSILTNEVVKGVKWFSPKKCQTKSNNSSMPNHEAFNSTRHSTYITGEKQNKEIFSSSLDQFTFDQHFDATPELHSVHIERTNRNQSINPKISYEEKIGSESEQKKSKLDALKLKLPSIQIRVIEPDQKKCNEKSFHCASCNYSCNFKSNLRKHEANHAVVEKTFRCNWCDYQCKLKCNLERHAITHARSDEKPFECEYCGRRFQCRSYLMKHETVHQIEKPHKCNVCDRTFKYFASKNRHESMHRKVKSYACYICKKSFDSSNVKRHSREKNYICNSCEKSFSNPLTANWHKHIRDCRATHKCDICIQILCGLSDLKARRSLEEEENFYKCKLCQKYFYSATSLNAHQKTHAKHRAYVCDVCRKCYFNLSNLIAHRKIHTDLSDRKPINCHAEIQLSEMPYKYEDCDAYLSNFLSKSKHTTMDEAQKANDLAGEGSRHLSNLNTGERDATFKCELCDISFINLPALNMHRSTHVRENIYECYMCDRKYGHPSNLLRLKKINTGEQIFMCDSCNKSFFYMFQQSMHTRIHAAEMS